MKLFAYVFVVIGALIFPAQVNAKSEEHGRFLSGLDLYVPLEESRDFVLNSPLEFVDPAQRRWLVPSGTTVNGASIPRFFWTFIGGPWDGRYNLPSVVHDYFVTTKSRPWQDVHRVFYNAMRANGVGSVKAALMYAAVLRFGPRWTNIEHNFEVCTKAALNQRSIPLEDVSAMCATPFQTRNKISWDPPRNHADWEELRALGERGGTIVQIQALVEAQLSKVYTPEMMELGFSGHE